MKRRLSVVLVGLFAFGVIAVAFAQTTGINDQETRRLILPGTNTTGERVHANRTEMNLRLPAGDIWASGGYKNVFAYAHGDFAIPNISATAAPLAGSSRFVNVSGSLGTATGPLYQQPGYAGSIIGVSLALNTALTTGAAHAEATIFTLNGGAIVRTQLRALVAVKTDPQGTDQYNVTTQAKDVDVFTAAQGVGCQINTSSDLRPLNALGVCSVIVEF